MSAPTTSPPPAPADTLAQPSVGALLAELEVIAAQTDSAAERCGILFSRLRKAQGSPRLPGLLAGMEVHLRRGGPVGARLLAAWLDVATHADRLLPRLRRFSSSRRLFLRLHGDERGANAFSRDWVSRLVAASEGLPERGEPAGRTGRRPGHEYPWPQARTWLDGALQELIAAPDGPSDRTRQVRDWLRLELDALEERVSHVAGTVNPFRVSTVQRLLPILSELDVGIRDGRVWLNQISEGHLEQSLRRPGSRALERIEAGEFENLVREFETVGAQRLQKLLRRRIETARPAVEMADDILRLQWIGQALVRLGAPGGGLDLLSATEIAVDRGDGNGLDLELPAEARAAARRLFTDPAALEPALAGAALRDEGVRLFLPRRDAGSMRADWPHGLPVVRDGRIDDAPLEVAGSVATAAEKTLDDGGAAATKRLVMNSLQTMSILLALLRNPKVTAIPGLVGEVAMRTRNPQIIATIATDRALYTGFANRDVPLRCLWNPSNVSVKVLRKFIHVKYVSKLDLQRLSQDRAGVRRELRHEIDRYLETLA